MTKIAMKKIFLLFLVLISIVLLIMRFSSKGAEILLNIKPKSGISLLSEPSDARVFLDGLEVGRTPYENQDLDPKEYLVKLEKDGLIWQGRVRLNEKTVSVVNRELSSDQAFSGGEILTLEKGKGLTVVSNAFGAAVEVDGKSYGQTPVSFDIIEGEHTISVSHPNYIDRNIRALIPAEFNLVLSVDLLLSEPDLTTISTQPIKTTPELKVKDTPTGFLRVRDQPSLSGKEITRVNPDDVLILLEELSGWDRVRLVDGTEGYVSARYVEKQSQ